MAPDERAAAALALERALAALSPAPVEVSGPGSDRCRTPGERSGVDQAQVTRAAEAVARLGGAIDQVQERARDRARADARACRARGGARR